jgi:hypothetical protein
MMLRLLGGEPERFQAVVISVAKVVDGSGHVWGRFHSMGEAERAKEQLQLQREHANKRFFAEAG